MIKVNKEYSGIINQRRRSKNMGLKADFTEEQWLECLINFNLGCAYCGEHFNIQQEHLISIRLNGEYTKSNIIPACKSCNCSKNNSNFLSWYAEQRFFQKSRVSKIFQWVGNETKDKIKSCCHWKTLNVSLYLREMNGIRELEEKNPSMGYFKRL